MNNGRVKSRVGRRAAVAAGVLLSLAISALPPACAIVLLDTAFPASIALEYRHGDRALVGASFRLYRVADCSETARFTLSEDFADYPVKINDLDANGWSAAASTLATYVEADRLPAPETKKTDQAGRIDFDEDRTGLYLLMGDDLRIGKTTYTTTPFLVSLPTLEDDDTWSYDVTVYPKCSAKADAPSGAGDAGEHQDVSVEVIKLWEDEGGRQSRPEEILVSLLRNGKTYDTVVLSAKNYWRHTWRDLNGKYNWSVLEENVPKDYQVTYTGNRTAWVITNAYIEQPAKGQGVESGGDNPQIPEQPNPELPAKSEQPPSAEGRLPQTGQIWWPVPILAALGLVIFGVGWIDTFRGRRRE